MSAPICVQELSLALAHRWEPDRLFMFVFTAYLDESGTHDGSPVTVIGGLLARAEQWRGFERGFAQAQKTHGFHVWHSRKFKRRTGDFKGWKPEQCHALYWELAHLTGRGLTDGAVVTLSNADYETYYRAGDKPRRARLDTKYGLCFRLCLFHFLAQVLKRQHRKKLPLLHLVLEAGHKNYGDAERIFFELKASLESDGIHVLRTITKAEKDQCVQLMMADFTAHSEYVLETRRPHTRDMTSSPIPKGEVGISHIRPKPAELAKWRADAIERTAPRRQLNAASGLYPASKERPS